MNEPLDMSIPAKCADELKNFEAMFLNKMIHTRDMLWQQFSGAFITPEDQKKYDDLNAKCATLQEFVNSIRGTISIAGVAGGAGEDFVRTIASSQIVGEDGFRRELFEEQGAEMDRISQKFTGLYSYAL